MSAIGENHRRSVHSCSRRARFRADVAYYRLRRNLASAFSNDAIRNLSSVFYDSAYKVRIWFLGRQNLRKNA